MAIAVPLATYFISKGISRTAAQPELQLGLNEVPGATPGPASPGAGSWHGSEQRPARPGPAPDSLHRAPDSPSTSPATHPPYPGRCPRRSRSRSSGPAGTGCQPSAPWRQLGSSATRFCGSARPAGSTSAASQPCGSWCHRGFGPAARY